MEEIMNMNLKQIGFDAHFETEFNNLAAEGLIPGRVALEHKRMYRVWTEEGELLCEVSGKYAFAAGSREDYPAVGDWVAVKPRTEEQKGTIQALLPRKGKFSRKMAGNTTEEQIVAANVSTIFLVNSLNDDLNLRRIERYLLLAWESGANPVIILTKADLCEDADEKKSLVESISMGVPVIPVSVMSESGIAELRPYIGHGSTVALLGSSGVGKSTLTNYLIGKEVQKVQEIREDDDKGKHTTTHRELFILPDGGVLIDTPGMRELQLWNSENGLSESFSDIEALADSCRFRDCSHEDEPGCAVRTSIKDGAMEESRLASYKKLQRELAYLDRRMDKKAQSDEKKKWKSIHKQIKHKTRH